MNKFILSEYTGISYLKEMKTAGVQEFNSDILTFEN
jgi:hypothetical protein